MALITNVTSGVMSINGSWISTSSIAYNVRIANKNIRMSVISVGDKITITGNTIEVSLLLTFTMEGNATF